MNLGLSGQPKHTRDIGVIFKAKKDLLDYGYIDGWVDRLGLNSLWTALKDDSVEPSIAAGNLKSPARFVYDRIRFSKIRLENSDFASEFSRRICLYIQWRIKFWSESLCNKGLVYNTHKV